MQAKRQNGSKGGGKKERRGEGTRGGGVGGRIKGKKDASQAKRGRKKEQNRNKGRTDR
jgi:hypothetical protein